MPAKKTSQSTATKVKATSSKAVKAPAKRIAKPAKQETAKTTAALEKKVKKPASKSISTQKTTTTPPPASSAPHIPREDIQLRAYFISERRQTMGWPGNSSTDWIEAESQLVAEAKRRLKKTL
jgi:hypothetical protein